METGAILRQASLDPGFYYLDITSALTLSNGTRLSDNRPRLRFYTPTYRTLSDESFFYPAWAFYLPRHKSLTATCRFIQACGGKIPEVFLLVRYLHDFNPSLKVAVC